MGDALLTHGVMPEVMPEVMAELCSLLASQLVFMAHCECM